MAQLSCQEIIDEIQARVGRPDAVALVDTTWLTRRINECQHELPEMFTGIKSLVFSNKTSLDTTGTYKYALSDITVGDTTDRRVCRITDVWYLDGNESQHLGFLPQDVFDRRYPDPTSSDNSFGKPEYWTQRDNAYIETYPYCASGYWDTDMRFDGDFYPADFSTDSTEVSDITRADEGLIRYGVWQAWKAIGMAQTGVAAEIISAQKAWSNPYPGAGEQIGWLEQYGDKVSQMVAWNSNLYVESA